ncbi:hypothetical protein QBC47DRAFT_413098 [Echria macrotheca]|uniref:Uncharacterized protein n=1 Tax=Echria macrotheca TaxID=438768 RepID=A0AAJ0BE12_9PEZI|nr:hypothetical protein QBC47DRAFT_413098 [Echria macrotheca]
MRRLLVAPIAIGIITVMTRPVHGLGILVLPPPPSRPSLPSPPSPQSTPTPPGLPPPPPPSSPNVTRTDNLSRHIIPGIVLSGPGREIGSSISGVGGGLGQDGVDTSHSTSPSKGDSLDRGGNEDKGDKGFDPLSMEGWPLLSFLLPLFTDGEDISDYCADVDVAGVDDEGDEEDEDDEDWDDEDDEEWDDWDDEDWEDYDEWDDDEYYKEEDDEGGGEEGDDDEDEVYEEGGVGVRIPAFPSSLLGPGPVELDRDGGADGAGDVSFPHGLDLGPIMADAGDDGNMGWGIFMSGAGVGEAHGSGDGQDGFEPVGGGVDGF